MTACKIELPVPPRSLWGNQRGHTRHKSRDTKSYRNLADLVILNEMNRKNFVNLPWEHVEIASEWWFTTNRRRDDDNMLIALKPVRDAAQNRGLIYDDSNAFCTNLKPTIVIVPSIEECVRITFVQVAAPTVDAAHCPHCGRRTRE